MIKWPDLWCFSLRKHCGSRVSPWSFRSHMSSQIVYSQKLICGCHRSGTNLVGNALSAKRWFYMNVSEHRQWFDSFILCNWSVFFFFGSKAEPEQNWHCIRRVLSIKNRYSVSMCHSCKYIPIEIQLTRLIWCFNKEYQQNAARVSQHAETLICLIIYLHSKSVRLHV